jgi:dolichol-phosphate hexosyltransferase
VYKGHSITAIIPCLNEEKAIGHVLQEIPEFVDEVIVVDNNSSDRTADIARDFGATVVHEPLAGYGRAYKRGFATATGDIIVTLDGDHTYPVSGISYLLEAFLHLQVDFLNTSRFPLRDREAMSFRNAVGNFILSAATSILYFKWVRDSQSGMWVFRRALLDRMQLESDGMALSEEIKIEALRLPDVRFGEISIMYSTRRGETKLNPYRDGLNNLWFLVRKRFAKRKPVR